MENLSIQELETLLSTVDIEKLTAGAKIDWNLIPNKLTILCIMAHCVLNGPVGVGKKTTFPLVVGETTIKASLGNQGSSSSWEVLCLNGAQYLEKQGKASKGAHVRKFGKPWPLAKDPKRA